MQPGATQRPSPPRNPAPQPKPGRGCRADPEGIVAGHHDPIERGTEMKSIRLKQLGQGMTEYIIIVALIAIAAIAIYGLFGETIREQMGIMTEELAGQDASLTRDANTNASGEADNKGLDTFDD